MWSDRALVLDQQRDAFPDAGASATPLRLEDGKFAIRVENLSKCYLIYDRPQDRLKQSIAPRLARLAGRPPRNY